MTREDRRRRRRSSTEGSTDRQGESEVRVEGREPREAMKGYQKTLAYVCVYNIEFGFG